jgi:poly(hydroxyalkanoate) depolymerase family esterase
MLHGCSQDARGFAASTRMNRLAASAGFMVVYPEQDRLANIQACWNWFDTRSGRALAEAASIVAVIDQVCLSHPVDTRQIVVAGLSAGASMAALLALSHPAHFAAIAMHSGVGPGLAKSSVTALGVMRGHIPAGGTALAGAASTLPALLVIQGNRDGVVSPVNGGLAARRWAAIANASPVAPREVKRGARYPSMVTDWKVGRRVVATLAEIQGLGHAWSGGTASQAFSDPAGPDASRMVWAFAQREFARRELLAQPEEKTRR